MPTLTRISTTRFGEIDAPEAERYRLLRPLAGFPATAQLLRIEVAGQAPFVWLQSAQEPAVAFVAVPAALARPGYRVALAPWDRDLWGALDGGETLALLNFQAGPTVNLAAPVLLDARGRRALQTLNQEGAWGLTEALPGC